MQNITYNDLINEYSWLTTSPFFIETFKNFDEDLWENNQNNQNNQNNETNNHSEMVVPVCKINEEEFVILFKVIRFWGIKKFSPELLDELLKFDSEIAFKTIEENVFDDGKKFYMKIHRFLTTDRYKLSEIAAEYKDKDILEYCYIKSYPISTKTGNIVAKNGWIHFLKQFKLTESMLNHAIMGEQMNCINYILDSDIKPSISTCEIAAGKSFELFQFIFNKGFRVNGGMFINASRASKIQTLDFILNTGYVPDYSTLLCSAPGQLDCLIFMVERGLPICYGMFYKFPGIKFTFEGKIGILKYLCQKRIINQENFLISDCAEDLECVKFLHENGYSLAKNSNRIKTLEDIITAASHHGNIDVIKYALENGAEIRPKSTFYACVLGKHEILKLLYENGAMLHHSCEEEVGKNGSIECAKFLVSLIECDKSCLAFHSISNGHIDILKLIDGTEITNEHVLKALQNYKDNSKNSLECLEYCLKFYKSEVQVWEYCAGHGKVELMKIALENSCDIGDSFQKAIANGRLEILMLLNEYGYKPNRSHLLFARKRNDQDCFNYMKSLMS